MNERKPKGYYTFEKCIEIIKPYVEEFNDYPKQQWFRQNGYNSCIGVICSNGWREDIIKHYNLNNVRRRLNSLTYEEVRSAIKEWTDIYETFPKCAWLIEKGFYTESKKYKKRLCEDLGIEYTERKKSKNNPITKEELIKKIKSISTDGMMPTRTMIKKAYGVKESNRIDGGISKYNLTTYEMASLCDLTPTSKMINYHKNQLRKRSMHHIRFKAPDTSHLQFPVDKDEITKLLSNKINKGQIHLTDNK